MGKTSWQVKQRYNGKVYARLGFQFDKRLVAKFKEKCEASGVSQAMVIKEIIEQFLSEE